MIKILKKLQSASKNSTTYRVGLLQAKVYRILKNKTGEALSDYGISTIEWALLGLLFDCKAGLRASKLAEELGVEAPFITVLFAKLKKMGLVDHASDPKDSRVKIMHLTTKGTDFVPGVEKHVRAQMRPLVSGSAISDVLSYVTVLETIIENGKAGK